MALCPVSNLVEQPSFVTLLPTVCRVREWVALESCLCPSHATLASHISVSDLHDHQSDVPVLGLVQLMHQLPIITL